jgi:putative lipoic acid-binding regulatory protein
MTVNDCKPKIAYPCRWSYKVIGRDLEELHGAIAEILEGSEHTATLSRSSKGRSYHCLNVMLTVESEPVRLGLYERLCRHPAVLIVM